MAFRGWRRHTAGAWGLWLPCVWLSTGGAGLVETARHAEEFGLCPVGRGNLGSLMSKGAL